MNRNSGVCWCVVLGGVFVGVFVDVLVGVCWFVSSISFRTLKEVVCYVIKRDNESDKNNKEQESTE